MELLKKFGERLKNGEFKDQKVIKCLFWIGMIGICLIFFSEWIPGKAPVKTENTTLLSCFCQEKVQKLEKRLEEMISKIDGAGKTKVMLTLDTSEQYHYLTESVSRSSRKAEENEEEKEEEIARIDDENGEKPVLQRIDESKIRGVLVVCQGGDNAEIKESILNAVCAVLNLSSDRVSIAKMA